MDDRKTAVEERFGERRAPRAGPVDLLRQLDRQLLGGELAVRLHHAAPRLRRQQQIDRRLERGTKAIEVGFRQRHHAFVVALVRGTEVRHRDLAYIRLRAGDRLLVEGTPEHIDALRKVGYSDGDIAEIVAHVSLNLFTNYFNHVAKTEIDFPLAPKLS